MLPSLYAPWRNFVTQRRSIFAAMQPTVFLGSAALVIAFVAFSAFFSDQAKRVFGTIQTSIITNFGWFYVLTATLLLLFVIWLLVSRFGSLRLGGDDSQPEFSYFAWFTMLFSAGMGIGLVFWGVAEPLTHYAEPPTASPLTHEAAREAFRFAYFHWGFHPWAIYIVFGLSLAYFHFRHGLPLAPRSLLYPVLGKRIYGLPGHLVDILATVGTLFGVATSLGLGAMQINSGISKISDFPQETGVQIGIIATITLVATISVVSGVKNGIRRLSELNMVLAFILFLFVLLAGPTIFLLDMFVTNLGGYLQNLPHLSFWIDLREDSSWQADWTLFYWSWWISWSPFVGVFVARISKGRTIREFVLSVFFIPTLATFLWITVFGGTGLHIDQSGGVELAQTAQQNASLALHAMLDELPWTSISSILATAVIVIFFITSSDSGSLVDDMVTSGGHPHPPKAQRVFWAVSEGTVAATLLLAGGLQALRTASLTSGLPMAVFLLFAAYGIFKAVRVDAETKGVPKRKQLT